MSRPAPSARPSLLDRVIALGCSLVAFTRAMPLFASGLYVTLVAVILMIFVDRPLALWLKSSLDPHVFGFFKTITDFGLGGHWYLLFVGMGLLCWALSSLSHTVEGHALWRARVEPWLYALSVMIASGIGIQLLKFAFGRYRPKFLFSDGIYGFAPFSGNNSFPSGHSQNIWAAMMALWFIFPRYRPVWVVVGLAISLSRVFTTVHFLSDVLMGSSLAILTAIWFKQMFDSSHKRGAVEWH
jgi:membrane-associated phospholipid phosphatase